MYKVKNTVVTLKTSAKESVDKMLSELRVLEPTLKIDRSRLVSFIVIDYFEKLFTKSLKRIIEAHKDSRKQIKNKLNELSNRELDAVSKYIAKMKSGTTKDE